MLSREAIGNKGAQDKPVRGIDLAVILAALCFGLTFALRRWAYGSNEAAMLAGVLILAAAVFALSHYAARFYCSRNSRIADAWPPLGRYLGGRIVHRHAFAAGSFAVLFALYCFSLLSVYPGFLGNDSMDIVHQALGEYERTNAFRYDGLSNHHPLLYTMMLRVIILLTPALSLEFQVFLFLLLQVVLVSLGSAWALSWLNRNGASRFAALFALMALCLVPVYALHAVTMFKDSLFAVALLLLALQAFEFSRVDRVTKRTWILLFLFLALVALLRNNGIFIDAACIAWLAFCVSPHRKTIIVSGACFLLCFAVLFGPVYKALGVEQSHFSESIGIPIQQVSLVTCNDGLTKEQEAFFENILASKRVQELYEKKSSNAIKFAPDFNDDFLEAHKVDYLANWGQVVAAHPLTALRAWVYISSEFMTPGIVAKAGTRLSLDNNEPKDLVGVGWNPRQAFNALQSMLPFVFSKGTAIWLVLWGLLLSLALVEKCRRRFATAAIPLLALLATMLIASPSGWDYRYCLPFVYMIPFLPYFIACARSYPEGQPVDRR